MLQRLVLSFVAFIWLKPFLRCICFLFSASSGRDMFFCMWCVKSVLPMKLSLWWMSMTIFMHVHAVGTFGPVDISVSRKKNIPLYRCQYDDFFCWVSIWCCSTEINPFFSLELYVGCFSVGVELRFIGGLYSLYDWGICPRSDFNLNPFKKYCGSSSSVAYVCFVWLL